MGKRWSSSTDASSPAVEPGQLVIIASRAENVAAVDKSGTSDPYAKVFVNGPGVRAELRTKEKMKTLHPAWGERFDVDDVKEPSSTSVRVAVKDYNTRSFDNVTGSSKPLGEFAFALSELELPTTGVLIEKCFELQQPASSRKATAITVTGTVFLKIGYLPLATAPPAAEAEADSGRVSNGEGDAAPKKRLSLLGRFSGRSSHSLEVRLAAVIRDAAGLVTLSWVLPIT
jgi:hypothetical protein